ncbi:M23 family metallopeptidase [Fluviispira sanaruensis]|uniref:Peptidase M23 domain-containing protein n=1 Tax=Fluviispira sanaruensis TaxID=2493639 RepID=A0A4P2VQX5_FLUSA|nr:M23 family metallopeptidase [Fluviispira sanaruensis]BBH54634.1 hypothetical protein JCM31447_31080 [Fluviispira sanaruensis]
MKLLKIFIIYILFANMICSAEIFHDGSQLKLVYPNPLKKNILNKQSELKNKHFKKKSISLKKSALKNVNSNANKKKLKSVFSNSYSYKHSYLFNADVMHPISGDVVSKFGWNAFGEGGFNTGILIKPLKKEVFSPAAGKIIFIGEVDGYTGKTIAIKSDNFFAVISGKISGNFTEGMQLNKGQKIGELSSDNLNFEVRDFRGNPYDPIAVVSKKKRIVRNVNIFQAFEKLLLKHGFHPKFIPIMFCIANWESSLNPSATNYNRNKTLDIGLFQINSIWQKKCRASINQLYDIDANTRCALTVLKVQGLSAWVTYNKYASMCNG